MSDDLRDVWRLLARPAELTAAGLFVVEGRETIARLLRTDHEVVSLLLTPAARVALEPHLDGRPGVPVLPSETNAEPARERPVEGSRHSRIPAFPHVTEPPILEVTPAQMCEVTGFNFHRGALALAKRPTARTLDAVLQTVSPASAKAPAGRQDRPRHQDEIDGTRLHVEAQGRRPHAERRSVFVVLEHLVDVDNVGSCFRNARAFGASAVLLDDRCADPLYRKAVRTSMGTVLELPWTIAPIVTIVDALHSRGISTVALTPDPDAPELELALRGIDAVAPVALVVGNEGHGLSADTLARCTHRARIPMAAGADSLNVATALAVGLYTCG